VIIMVGIGIVELKKYGDWSEVGLSVGRGDNSNG